MRITTGIAALILFCLSNCLGGKDSLKNTKLNQFFSIDLTQYNCFFSHEEEINLSYFEAECNEWKVTFDGEKCNYSSNQTYSRFDYLKRKMWLIEVMPKIPMINDTTPLEEIYRKIKVLSIDDSLRMQISYEGYELTHKVIIPEELRNINEYTDTTSFLIRRIIYRSSNTDLYSCYLINKDDFHKNCPIALTIHLTPKENIGIKSVIDFLDKVEYNSND